LVFFRIRRRRASNAGRVEMYFVNVHFIEAPHTGRRIRFSHMDNDYWRKRYLGARGLLERAKIGVPPQLHGE
ncbi:hypothetical protein J2R62_17485, partial [Plesiomonas shigelloides]